MGVVHAGLLECNPGVRSVSTRQGPQLFAEGR